MEQDIEEVKELVQKNLALAQDTNRVVHKMLRAARWGRFFQIVWWVAVLAISGAAYYYYLEPYVAKLGQAYAQVQASGKQAQGFEQQVQDFLKNLGTSQTATSSHQ